MGAIGITRKDVIFLLIRLVVGDVRESRALALWAATVARDRPPKGSAALRCGSRCTLEVHRPPGVGGRVGTAVLGRLGAEEHTTIHVTTSAANPLPADRVTTVDLLIILEPLDAKAAGSEVGGLL